MLSLLPPLVGIKVFPRSGPVFLRFNVLKSEGFESETWTSWTILPRTSTDSNVNKTIISTYRSQINPGSDLTEVGCVSFQGSLRFLKNWNYISVKIAAIQVVLSRNSHSRSFKNFRLSYKSFPSYFRVVRSNLKSMRKQVLLVPLLNLSL